MANIMPPVGSVVRVKFEDDDLSITATVLGCDEYGRAVVRVTGGSDPEPEWAKHLIGKEIVCKIDLLEVVSSSGGDAA